MKPVSIEKMALQSDSPHIDTPLARMLRSAGRFSVRHGKVITAAAVVLIAFSIAGIFRIEINDNPVRWFKANHPIRVADRVLNEHFAGTYDAFIVFEADNAAAVPTFIDEADAMLEGLDATIRAPIRQALEAESGDASAYFGNLVAAIDDAMFDADSSADLEVLDELMLRAEDEQVRSKVFQRPDMLQMIADMQAALDSSPYVGKTNDLPDVVRVVNRELRSGADADYTIPDSVPGVAQTLMQFQSSHRPHDLWHIVTPDFSSTA